MVYGRGSVYGEAGRESVLESPEPLLYPQLVRGQMTLPGWAITKHRKGMYWNEPELPES